MNNIETYKEKDIVRLIVKGRGCCVGIEQKGSQCFGDLSPACVGLAKEDPTLEKVLAIFNSSPSSYRVFNEIHINEGDRNLTIGCGHYANASLAKMFLGMPSDAWEEFRAFVMDKLKNNDSYIQQYEQDYVVKGFMNKRKIKSRKELKEQTVLADSIDYFFARDLLIDKETKQFKSYSDIKSYSNIKNELINRYKYNNKQSLTITGSNKSYLSLWADTVLLLSAIGKESGKPSEQYNVYRDYPYEKNKQSYSLIACTKFVDGIEDKSSSPVCVRLFPGHSVAVASESNNYWFYRILYDALLIKSVANWQHDLWVKDYYVECDDCVTVLNSGEEKEEEDKEEKALMAIRVGLISWKSSGVTINKNPPFNLEKNKLENKEDKYWRNMGNQYYLNSTTKVLVNINRENRQGLIDACLKKYGKIFTGLIIWAQFIMTKRKIRNRQRAMWTAYFEEIFNKDDKTSFNVNQIKNVNLIVSDKSVILELDEEIKEKKEKKTIEILFIE